MNQRGSTEGGRGQSCSATGPGVAAPEGPGRRAELCSGGRAGRGQGRSSRQASGSLLEPLHSERGAPGGWFGEAAGPERAVSEGLFHCVSPKTALSWSSAKNQTSAQEPYKASSRIQMRKGRLRKVKKAEG